MRPVLFLPRLGMGLTATVTLPAIGAVSLSGAIIDSTHYDLSTTLPSLSLNNSLLATANIHLTASGLNVTGTASLPLIGSIPLTGFLQGGQYTLSANVPQLGVAGYTLSSAVVTVTASGISLTASASLPLFNAVTLSGTILDANQFALARMFRISRWLVLPSVKPLSPWGRVD